MHARQYLAAGPFCGNGVQRLTKAVLAREGDTVTLTRGGMIYKGHLLPNTAPLTRDGRGRPMPQLAPGRYVVPPGHLWLFSTHSPRTIDSRYFGPIPESRVRARWRPLWTEGHTVPTQPSQSPLKRLTGLSTSTRSGTTSGMKRSTDR